MGYSFNGGLVRSQVLNNAKIWHDMDGKSDASYNDGM